MSFRQRCVPQPDRAGKVWPFDEEERNKEYRALVAATREIKTPTVLSPFFWIPAGAIALVILFLAGAWAILPRIA